MEKIFYFYIFVPFKAEIANFSWRIFLFFLIIAILVVNRYCTYVGKLRNVDAFVQYEKKPFIFIIETIFILTENNYLQNNLYSCI